MVDVNGTIVPIVESPVVQGLSKILGTVSIAIGGIFGLYLVLIFLRWKEARDLKRVLCDIRSDIKDMKNLFLKKKKK
jgi:hypothetical protein